MYRIGIIPLIPARIRVFVKRVGANGARERERETNEISTNESSDKDFGLTRLALIAKGSTGGSRVYFRPNDA